VGREGKGHYGKARGDKRGWKPEMERRRVIISENKRGVGRSKSRSALTSLQGAATQGYCPSTCNSLIAIAETVLPQCY